MSSEARLNTGFSRILIIVTSQQDDTSALSLDGSRFPLKKKLALGFVDTKAFLCHCNELTSLVFMWVKMIFR